MAKLPDSEIENARADIVAVIESFNVKLEKAGPKEYRACCPFHSEKSPSFTVTPGKGRFHCFGCGTSGTSIDFVMNYAGVDFREAVNIINGKTEHDITPREKRVIEREAPPEWVPIALVPDIAPSTPDTKYIQAPADFIVPNGVHSFKGRDAAVLVKHVAVARWAYRDAAGALIGYVVRFNILWGGKDTSPQSWCSNTETGELAWRWLSFGKPRPIYGLELLAANPKAQVLVVEGEKDCDAARALFAAAGVSPAKLVVIAWAGGGKAVKHTDWAPIAGRAVALWPDADQKPYPDNHPQAGMLMPWLEQPGAIAMRDIWLMISGSAKAVKLIMPPAGVPDGWGLADEQPAGFGLMAHMKTGVLAADGFAAPAPVVAVDEMPPTAPLLPWEGAPSDEDDDTFVAPCSAPAAGPAENLTAGRQTREQKEDAHDKLESPALTQNGYFRVLGYDHERYYILCYEKCQIMVYTKSDFSEPGLIELAPLSWWEEFFPGTKGGIEKKAAMNWMIRKAHTRGVYSMKRLRGRGAWEDKGRLVFHHGDYLTVDGADTEIPNMNSYYVYEMAEALPDVPTDAMSSDEGRDLLDLAAVFRWSKPASAALLAGWCALAPIGGAIKWRSHIWITGGAGGGKSTALNRYVHTLMHGMDLFCNGNSSEAGIRQTLKGDARPVLFDESESNNERETMRIQQVLAMVRQASTESQALTLKGTAGGDAMAFHIRSMFCLASIQVGLKQQADIERMTVLSILPKESDPFPAETWKRIDEALLVMQRDETLPGRLLRRCMNLLPITLKNIKTFSEAAAMRFGSQRDGDQYGTLLAGAWSLVSDDLAPIEAALAMIDSYDWSEHRENNEVDEGERALASLMGALIRVHGGADVTVNELIRVATGRVVDSVTVGMAGAEALLQRHGMRTEGSTLILANGHTELKRLMEGTPFEADLRGVLLRVKGAMRHPKAIKFSGVVSRAIALPLDNLLDDDIEPSPEQRAAGVAEF